MTHPAQRPVVLAIEHDPPSRFTTTDTSLMERFASVVRLRYPGRLSPRWILAAWRAVRRSDAIYAFFASEQAAVPFLLGWLFRKRLVLVAAGYDYANLPERGYGLRANGRGWLPWLLGSMADKVLPISEQTKWEFLRMVPKAADRTELSYLALDPEAWGDPGVERDEECVVTFGYIDEEAYSRKGIDRFLALARSDPSRRYVLGGQIEPSLRRRIAAELPGNVELTGFLGQDELRRLLWSAGVYAQLSWHETFGVAMAEAMLCGCRPLISDSMALKEVAGPWAVVSSKEAEDRKWLNEAVIHSRSGAFSRSAMRQEVAARFDLRTRQQALERSITGRAKSRPAPRAGSTRSVIPVRPGMRVLDVGRGAILNPRADVMCVHEVSGTHRCGRFPMLIGRPTVLADAGKLPFRGGAFDFATASHLADHLADPASFCEELSRVARAGYIEAPSPIAEVLFHEECPLWRVTSAHGQLRFARAGHRSTLRSRITGPFFDLNSRQPSGELSTRRGPGRPAGFAVKRLLRPIAGTLARLGLLHTRHRFSPTDPLRFRVYG